MNFRHLAEGDDKAGVSVGFANNTIQGEPRKIQCVIDDVDRQAVCPKRLFDKGFLTGNDFLEVFNSFLSKICLWHLNAQLVGISRIISFDSFRYISALFKRVKQPFDLLAIIIAWAG